MSTPDDAVYFVFCALKDLAPHVLVSLRDHAGDDREGAELWATAHGLASPCLIKYAHRLREYWRARPPSGKRLTLFLPLTASYRPQSVVERDWIAGHATVESLPDPELETPAAWIRRATALYAEREQLIYGRRRQHRQPPVRNSLPKHCAWFVHVLDSPRSQLGDRKAVKRALQKVERVLGVTCRRRPHGGRTKKIRGSADHAP